MITRRKFVTTGIATAAGLAVLPLTTRWAHANLTLGKTKIDVLSDGQLTLPQEFVFRGLPADELSAVLKKYNLGEGALRPDCNLTLLRNGEKTILFDVGSGPNFMPSAGKLKDALDAINLDPADVTDVVFTHAHPDHLWGALDDFDDPFFSEADYHIDKNEWDYWINPKTVNTIGEARQAFAAGALRNLTALEEKMSFFNSGEEILPGISARGSYGHTPGHTSFEVRSGSDSVMIVGDAIGNHHVAFEKPDWYAGSDQDQDLGAKTRALLLDQIASEKMQMIGYHLPYPGIGIVEKKDGAYRFAAA